VEAKVPKALASHLEVRQLSELKEKLKEVLILKLESIEYFRSAREAKLEWLITQAINYHYSTF